MPYILVPKLHYICVFVDPDDDVRCACTALPTRLDVNRNVGEFWFIIDAAWMSRWISFVMGRAGPPGPISNNNLFLHYTGNGRECGYRLYPSGGLVSRAAKQRRPFGPKSYICLRGVASRPPPLAVFVEKTGAKLMGEDPKDTTCVFQDTCRARGVLGSSLMCAVNRKPSLHTGSF